MNNTEKNIPITWINILSKEYPNCWKQCDKIVKSKGKALPIWGKHCVIPIAGTMAIVMGMKKGKDSLTNINNAGSDFGSTPSAYSLMAGLYAWKTRRKTYHLDKKTVEKLGRETDDFKMPTEKLLNMPYSAVWIDWDNDKNEEGILAWLEYDLERREYELRIEHLTENESYSLFYHLTPGVSVYESINQAIGTGVENLDILPPFLAKAIKKKLAHLLEYQTCLAVKMLRILLYACFGDEGIDPDDDKK